jgi:hypothetical protein
VSKRKRKRREGTITVVGELDPLRDDVFWFHRPTVDKIARVLRRSRHPGEALAAIALYMALCALASRRGSATLVESEEVIARHGRVSVSTLRRLLHAFEQLGIVRIQRGDFPCVELICPHR